MAAEQIASVTYLKGEAKVQHVGARKTLKVKLKDRLLAGDRLSTGNSARVEITFIDKTVVRLANNSNLELRASSEEGRKNLAVAQKQGRSWAHAAKPGEKFGPFRAGTPIATAAVKGTVFRTNVAADTSTRILVYQGEVEVGGVMKPQEGKLEEEPQPVEEPEEVTMEEWVEIVKEMQQIFIAPDGRHEVTDIPPEDARDEWVKWNQARDEAEE